ncbi:MAG: porphobilinogen synthase [Nitrososphaeraceae archaeon]
MNIDKFNTQFYSSFPTIRLRRLRKNQSIRDLLQEIRLSTKDLICPLFIQENLKSQNTSIPEINRISISKIQNEIQSILNLGINSVILFGLPSRKSSTASSAYSKNGIIQKSIREIRKNFGDKVVIITDVCMCEYTNSGHCGIIKNNIVDNDLSIDKLSKIANSHAESGADIVAPSAMMDGQVMAIRKKLDSCGFSDVSILSYASKLASPLYSPFRDLANSYPEFGNRKSYQLQPSNLNEALLEIQMDINEGSDMIMIKPAITCLDILRQIRERTRLPICAYSVSGEYAMIKAAAEKGWIDENEVILEFHTAIKRAGSDMMITYYAKHLAQILNQ